jgi:hypothetical protein
MSDEQPTVQLRKFDIRSIPKDAVIAFLGKRRTGKSTLVKDFFYYNRDFAAGTVVSGTEKLNSFFKDFIPKEFIHDKYSSPLIQNILQAQGMVIEHNKRASKDKQVDPSAFLVLDDCFYDDQWKRDEPMKEIMFNGRHFKLCLLMTMQYPIGIPPAFRANIDYVFILRETGHNDLKKIYENFCRASLRFSEFKELMEIATEDNQCLVIDNTSKSNKLEDQVFWYKAGIHNDKFLAIKDKKKKKY